MKYLGLASAIGLFLTASHTVCAGEIPSSDIEIISVAPRSPDVKPIAMSVPADGPRHDVATLATAQSPLPYTATGKLASEEGPKPASPNKGQR
jgi:hypothetical protein